MNNGLLEGKKGVICGITNNRSIGWGIAEILKKNGATIGFTYQNESFLKRITPLVDEIGVDFLIECDASSQKSIDMAFQNIHKKWNGKIDFLVHSIAFSDKKELKGPYYNTTQSNFENAMNISCYSFTSMAKHCKEMMENGGSLLTLSYYGAEKVMPNYNVMGVCKAALESSVRYLAVDLGNKNIRVNAISAGPIKTVAATGIEDFSEILSWNAANSALLRSVTQEDIGKAALFLISDLASGVTGEILYVDAGYHVVGMKNINQKQQI